MAKSSGVPEMERYKAMRLRVEAKPLRTIGDLFTLRREVMKDIGRVTEERNVLLDRVYGGAKGPPDTGRWNNHPHHRRLFFPVPPEPDRIKCISFGWSFMEPYRENRKRGWVMSWSEDWYKGYEDPRLLRDVVGRDPKNEIDELVCAGLVAEILGQNDEALGIEFWAVQHRLNQLWQRVSVVERNIEHSLLQILAKEHDWRPGREEPWRKVKFEDGTIVTLTSEGVMMFEDAVLTTSISLLSPSATRPTWPHDLAARQRRALERR